MERRMERAIEIQKEREREREVKERKRQRDRERQKETIHINVVLMYVVLDVHSAIQVFLALKKGKWSSSTFIFYNPAWAYHQGEGEDDPALPRPFPLCRGRAPQTLRHKARQPDTMSMALRCTIIQTVS